MGLDNPQETAEVDKAWLAGIIEGDGSIGMGFHIYKGSSITKRFAVKPTIGFSNQDGLLIERVTDLLAALSSKNPRLREVPGRYENSRTTISVALVGMEAVFRVLQAILPHLRGEKAARARLLYRFIESRMERHKGRGKAASTTPYNEEELVIIKQFQGGGRRKGGKQNPEIGGILRDYMQAIAAKQ